MGRIAVLLTGLLVLPSLVYGQQTVVGVEVESYFYADGEMKREAGRFENTYLVQEDRIIRTRVYDQTKKEVIPDNTTYLIMEHLVSHPKRFPSVGEKRRVGEWAAVIRAVGEPGSDAVETVVIGSDFIQTCKSASDYFVISRFRRIK